MTTTFSTGVEGSSEDFREQGAETTEAVPPVLIAPDGLRYVARQAILDASGIVHGYELLFRSGATATAYSGDGDTATRTVLDNTVIFGLEKLTGGLPAFVNCTREALLDRLAMVLPSEHTVLEILETLEPTPDLLEACQEYKAKGFRLALDDFAWKPEWREFIAIADYIKVDLSTTTAGERAMQRTKLRGSSALLLAERVETQADLKLARKEGFTLFQGYYFCRPVVMQTRTIPANRLVHLQMLQAVNKNPMNVQEVSDLVKRDASLTYRLLRIVNSPLYGPSQVVSSIRGALVLIGDAMFRRVAMLAIASELKGNHPTELLRMAFLRGRFCELLASITGQDPTEQYLLGILSLLPAMLHVSTESVANAMPLRKEIRRALVGNSNAERKVLDWLISYELGQWDCCDEISQAAGLPCARLPALYAEALLWAEANLSLAMN
jgi:EAL and modified HD-GYP domain-containing signal transduction protein